ncbi:MAG: hypothetical protein KC478_04400 [Bacteriovoracaceae bacterium]|nr:hypothetical protein [Bacteriovoracaceae bacterium]
MNKVNLGNSRLLHVKQSLNSIDLNLAAGVVDSYMSLSRQVELVTNSIVVYIKGDDLLVGKEIAGYPTELPGELEMADFELCEVVEHKMDQKCLDFKELMEKVALIEKDSALKIYRIVFDIQHFDAPILHFR